MNVEGIIFDWAGTTVDFGCMAPVRAFMDSFKANGIAVTEEETRKPMGMLKRDHIKTMLSMDRIAALWKEKYGRDWETGDIEKIYGSFEPELMSTLTNYTTVKPGIVDAVKKTPRHGPENRLYYRLHRQNDGCRRQSCRRTGLQTRCLVLS